MEAVLVRKPNPEHEALKEAATEAHDRLTESLLRLQRTLHMPEEVPDEDHPQEPLKNGKH
jgi:hypothetical protein